MAVFDGIFPCEYSPSKSATSKAIEISNKKPSATLSTVASAPNFSEHIDTQSDKEPMDPIDALIQENQRIISSDRSAQQFHSSRVPGTINNS